MSFHETLYRQIASDLGSEAPPFERVRYEFANGVATVTIAREDKLNALDSETITELLRAVLIAKADQAVRAVILTGAGSKAFVAGADIAEMATLPPDRARRFAEAWGSELFIIGDAGHINSASGLGSWPLGAELFRRFAHD